MQSGVLQGCPLASVLFVLAMEPFICLFQQLLCPQPHDGFNLSNRGVVTVCADDIAIVLQKWSDLPAVFRIFELARRAAGLSLKPRKCCIIPLSAPLTPHLIEVLRDFLVRYVPAWSQFNISDTAEYLGIWIGPAANSRQGVAQLAKYKSRLEVIAQSGAAAFVSVKAYNSKAITVFFILCSVLPSPCRPTRFG